MGLGVDLRPVNWTSPLNKDKLSDHRIEDEALAGSKLDHCPMATAHNREKSWVE